MRKEIDLFLSFVDERRNTIIMRSLDPSWMSYNLWLRYISAGNHVWRWYTVKFPRNFGRWKKNVLFRDRDKLSPFFDDNQSDSIPCLTLSSAASNDDVNVYVSIMMRSLFKWREFDSVGKWKLKIEWIRCSSHWSSAIERWGEFSNVHANSIHIGISNPLVRRFFSETFLLPK